MKYTVKVRGKQTGVNAHAFEGTFTFDKKDQAEAFADFKFESLLTEPEMEDVIVTKDYDQIYQFRK